MKDFFRFIIENDLITAAILFLTIIELSQSRKTRTAEILYNVFQDIHRSNFLNETEWLYTFDTSISIEKIDVKDKRRLDDIIDTFTRIAYLCDERVITYKDITHTSQPETAINPL